jgi:hypothetical protein
MSHTPALGYASIAFGLPRSAQIPARSSSAVFGKPESVATDFAGYFLDDHNQIWSLYQSQDELDKALWDQTLADDSRLMTTFEAVLRVMTDKRSGEETLLQSYLPDQRRMETILTAR